MDPYGFHDGDVWYRGRFTGSPEAQQIALFYGAGGAGMLQAFLDGKLVGQDELASGLPRPITTGLARFALPEAARAPGEHVLAVMVRNNGHNWDLGADEFHKEARGLVSVSIEAPGGRSFAVPVGWKIQGKAGGETLPDPARGPANNGGQYGERMGWHLPGFDDAKWAAATVSAGAPSAGTTWYRTRFDLAVPKGQDATIGARVRRYCHAAIEGALSCAALRQWLEHGTVHRPCRAAARIPDPRGYPEYRGSNTVALAVTSDGAPGDALEAVKLVTLRNVAGGVPVRLVSAPARPAELNPVAVR